MHVADLFFTAELFFSLCVLSWVVHIYKSRSQASRLVHSVNFLQAYLHMADHFLRVVQTIIYVYVHAMEG